jgi:alpha-L-arabinofuranosidase
MAAVVTIHTDETIGEIRPELHGHFLEHLGTATYGGIWVGRHSPIPNIDGLRRDAVMSLRDLGVPVLRWPGGCFADNYRWRDGIGDPGSRPLTVNHTWGAQIEDNGFGTHEFMHLCQLIGAQPYLAANVGSGSPAELRDWVEYCNQPRGSSLAGQRSANGSPLPFQVRYWGIGNESWACGGHMTAEEYCAQYARFATYVPRCGITAPYLIAVGPNGNDTEWTRRFFQRLRAGRNYIPMIHGFAMHFYSWGTRTARDYDAKSLRAQLSTFVDLERAIKEQRAYLDRLTPDPGRCRIDLLVDEWGTWDKSEPDIEEERGLFWQQNTMKDGVAAALGLNVFHRQANNLAMCNLAQIANVLQAPLLTDKDRCLRTPTYHAFSMMRTHKGKTALHIEADPSTNVLSVSASRSDRSLSVTLVNADPLVPIPISLRLTRGAIADATATILAHPDWNACNTFEEPDVLIPHPHVVRLAGKCWDADLPPMSVVQIEAQYTRC